MDSSFFDDIEEFANSKGFSEIKLKYHRPEIVKWVVEKVLSGVLKCKEEDALAIYDEDPKNPAMHEVTYVIASSINIELTKIIHGNEEALVQLNLKNTLIDLLNRADAILALTIPFIEDDEDEDEKGNDDDT